MKDNTEYNKLRRLLKPFVAQENWRMYFMGMGIISTWFIFDVFSVWVFKKVGDYVEAGAVERIWELFVIFAVVFVIFYIWKYFTRKKTYATSRYELSKFFWKRQIKKYFSMDFTYTEKVGTGKIISIIQDGVINWTILGLELQHIFPNVVIKFGFTIVLLWFIGWQYFLVFLGAFVLTLLFIVFINSKYAVPLRVHRKEFAVSSMRRFLRILMSKQEVVQAGRQDDEIEDYLDLITNQQSINYKITKFIYLMYNIPIILVQAIGVATVYYAYISLSNGTFSLGLFTALIGVIGYLSALMLKVSDAFKNFADEFIHIEKMWDLLDNAPKTQNIYTGEKFIFKKGDFSLNRITFAYDDGTRVFHDFSLEIEGGKKTALVGVSGVGKSTLVKILAGYIMPDKGSISVDGQSFADIALASYFKHVAYLSQQPNVFDGTVKENLLYREDQFDGNFDKKIDEVLTMAKCEFVYDLPDGIDTEIGERGIRLSGGQRQRLAIAKIFLQNPEIILLDEPTSALDSFSEDSVAKAMQKLFEGRTVIIIAHRLQTVKDADRILLMEYDQKAEKSRIVEDGNHKELVKQDGVYAKMLEVQTGF